MQIKEIFRFYFYRQQMVKTANINPSIEYNDAKSVGLFCTLSWPLHVLHDRQMHTNAQFSFVFGFWLKKTNSHVRTTTIVRIYHYHSKEKILPMYTALKQNDKQRRMV